MADPIEVLLQNVAKPEFDAVMLTMMILGVILSVLVIITHFIRNKKFQTQLFDIEVKIKIFIEKKREINPNH